MSKKVDERYLQQLREMELEIAGKSKAIVNKILALRFFTNWLTSFSHNIDSGTGNADIVLTYQQAREFAFDLPRDNPESLVLFCQKPIFTCFKDIDIKCFFIDEDGIVGLISSIDEYDIYIAELSFKIPVSDNVKHKLIEAQAYCKSVSIALLEYDYDAKENDGSWVVTDIHDISYPIVKNAQEAKEL
ncbi:hypothetical protein A7M79_00015 [Acinetobacter baumannii]|uniref:hypothetical protein n=1 Tax=Acinetobacter baumannii TaxID=470 RepID=UPI0008DE7229|nr:hypothetical protein [Acinetobacter baumannii]OIH11907.1 hypothetical protein A7M79_00015 [Acinetobacter baumannii]